MSNRHSSPFSTSQYLGFCGHQEDMIAHLMPNLTACHRNLSKAWLWQIHTALGTDTSQQLKTSLRSKFVYFVIREDQRTLHKAFLM